MVVSRTITSSTTASTPTTETARFVASDTTFRGNTSTHGLFNQSRGFLLSILERSVVVELVEKVFDLCSSLENVGKDYLVVSRALRMDTRPNSLE